jgi:hypothetical protein
MHPSGAYLMFTSRGALFAQIGTLLFDSSASAEHLS